MSDLRELYQETILDHYRQPRNAGRLPATMRTALEAGAAGLGQILLASGLESRREGLWCGREHLRSLPAPVAALTDGDFLTRSYRVTVGGLPLNGMYCTSIPASRLNR